MQQFMLLHYPSASGSETAGLRLLLSQWSYYLPPGNNFEGMKSGGVQHANDMFNVQQLQQDIVATYLSGKAYIEDASLLRIPFNFISTSSDGE